jgi:hypothetical protein
MQLLLVRQLLCPGRNSCPNNPRIAMLHALVEFIAPIAICHKAVLLTRGPPRHTRATCR